MINFGSNFWHGTRTALTLLISRNFFWWLQNLFFLGTWRWKRHSAGYFSWNFSSNHFTNLYALLLSRVFLLLDKTNKCKIETLSVQDVHDFKWPFYITDLFFWTTFSSFVIVISRNFFVTLTKYWLWTLGLQWRRQLLGLFWHFFQCIFSSEHCTKSFRTLETLFVGSNASQIT